MSQRASDGTVLGDEGGGTAPEVPTVCPGYTVEFPSPLPPFPEFYRFACLDPDPEKREGIYTRLVSRAGGTERCLQIILYYRVQWLPYHVNDFAPAFLYLDPEGRVQELIYDPGHHRAASVLQPRDLRLTVVAPWHAMRRRAPGPLGRPLRAAQYELRDSVIRAWWFHPNGAAQLKLPPNWWTPGTLGSTHGTAAAVRSATRRSVPSAAVQR